MTQTPDLPPDTEAELNPHTSCVRDDVSAGDHRPERFSTGELVAIVVVIGMLLAAGLKALGMVLDAQVVPVLIIASASRFVVQALRVLKGCPEPRHPIVDVLRSIVGYWRSRDR